MPIDGAPQAIERRLQARMEEIEVEAWERVMTMARQRDAAEAAMQSLREANVHLRVMLAEAQVHLRTLVEVEKRVDQLEKKKR